MSETFSGKAVIVHSAADIPRGGIGPVSDKGLEDGFACITMDGDSSVLTTSDRNHLLQDRLKAQRDR